MYRYSIDNAVTYTSEDLVLFKESPFACWMERLTLENPEHGILPNDGSGAPADSMEPQDDLADTLRAEGKQVALVAWELAESQRRTDTVGAMRQGVDFIVNGQLALGSLSGSANLLMRTSGYSDLGNFLYVPCNTQRKVNLHSALRLCFLADLLHSLQGQLPPQMLIIRGDSDVLPLQTENHIYHYRAVKQRFMDAQQAFRKHRMPDPAESSHFGRWEDCANEVIKQRALRNDANVVLENLEQVSGHTRRQTVSAGTAYDLDEVSSTVGSGSVQAYSQPRTGGTLAEQARNMATTTHVFVDRRRVSDERYKRPEQLGMATPATTDNSDSAAYKAHPLDSPGFQRAAVPMASLDRGDTPYNRRVGEHADRGSPPASFNNSLITGSGTDRD